MILMTINQSLSRMLLSFIFRLALEKVLSVKLLTSIIFNAMIVWNLCVYIIYRIDKRRAVNGEWRIKEKTLLWCAILFGSLGAWEAIFSSRHKSKHWNFKIVVSLALFVHLVFLFCIMRLEIFAWDLHRLFR